MKRTLLIAFGLAALVTPVASAGGPAPVSPVQRIIAQESRVGHVSTAAPSSPVQRIIVQEDARRNDPALMGSGPAVAPVQIVETGGFHWADAGIGAAVVAAAMLILAGTTLAFRVRRPSRA